MKNIRIKPESYKQSRNEPPPRLEKYHQLPSLPEQSKSSLQQALWKFYPTKLLSRNPSTFISTSKQNLVYERSPLSTLSITPKLSQPILLDDFYGDRSQFENMKNYKDCPAVCPVLSSEAKNLEFDSCFETGNLWRSYKLSKREFVLLLQHDSEAPDYSYWYHFRVKNNKVGPYKFHIINITRYENLVAQGMRPAVFSSIENQWRRGGTNVSFYQTKIFSEYLRQRDRTYYTLSFTYEFQQQKDTVYFAYSYPYSYSTLKSLLNQITDCNPHISTMMSLSKTLGKNDCDCLVITQNVRQAISPSKQAVILTARVHPCEAQSSYVMHGLIEFLASNQRQAVQLRRQFIFYLVPMLNPDGVRHGNARCSLLGVDLNRRWGNPNKIAHPTVFYAKKLISEVNQHSEIALFCDLHGHSKNQNVFMYGCKKGIMDTKSNLKATLIPKLMSELFESFSLENTHYKMEKPKESAARIAVFKDFKVVNSYTLECSMHGPIDQPEYSIQDFKDIGVALAKSCLGLTPKKMDQYLQFPAAKKVIKRSRSYYEQSAVSPIEILKSVALVRKTNKRIIPHIQKQTAFPKIPKDAIPVNRNQNQSLFCRISTFKRMIKAKRIKILPTLSSINIQFA